MSRVLESHKTQSLTRRPLPPSRRGAYAALGAGATFIPLPWVPDLALARVRGAVLQELCARYGLSLSPAARSFLEEPARGDFLERSLRRAVRFIARRMLSRFTPVGWVTPLWGALSVSILAHLFERYLDTARTLSAVVVDLEEAKRFKAAMDRAMILAFTLEGVLSPWADAVSMPDDDREAGTKFSDGVVYALASLPSWVTKRLDAGFDEAITTDS